MTTFNKSSLQAIWVNGFVPQGSDYTNLIQSQVNIAETAEQDMAGALGTTELITPKVSAANVNVTTMLSANNMVIAGTITGNVSLTGDVSAAGLNVLNSVRCSALRFTGSTAIGIVSATGTAQTTAALLTYSVNRLQGVTDGQTTGFLLQPPNVGTYQRMVNETAVSANLWPSVGCSINGKTANTVFSMAANTSYDVIHSYTSGYSVK